MAYLDQLNKHVFYKLNNIIPDGELSPMKQEMHKKCTRLQQTAVTAASSCSCYVFFFCVCVCVCVYLCVYFALSFIQNPFCFITELTPSVSSSQVFNLPVPVTPLPTEENKIFFTIPLYPKQLTSQHGKSFSFALFVCFVLAGRQGAPGHSRIIVNSLASHGWRCRLVCFYAFILVEL